jgi:sterol 14-demethylase
MYEQLRFVRSSLALSQLKKSVGVIETEAKAYFERRWGNSGEVLNLHFAILFFLLAFFFPPRLFLCLMLLTM